MLRFIKKIFSHERRSHPRHPVKGSFHLVVPVKKGTAPKRKVHIINMSPGGAAFLYEGSPDDLPKSGLVSLSSGMCVAMGFETISDIECQDGSPYRKRRIKFGRMN